MLLAPYDSRGKGIDGEVTVALQRMKTTGRYPEESRLRCCCQMTEHGEHFRIRTFYISSA